jgi:hypothetical protein
VPSFLGSESQQQQQQPEEEEEEEADQQQQHSHSNPTRRSRGPRGIWVLEGHAACLLT